MSRQVNLTARIAPEHAQHLALAGHEAQSVVRRYDKVVPANKSRLLLLDDRVVGDIDETSVLVAFSNVPGVQMWTFSDSAPAIDEDTALLGWLLDPTAPDYDHEHGNAGTFSPHQAGVAYAGHGGVLPCFQRYISNGAVPTLRWNYHDRTTDAVLDWAGTCMSFPTQGAIGGTRHQANLHYMLGQDNYLNLGTGHDGLRFFLHCWVEDKNFADGCRAVFYNYPFTSQLLDPADIPTTNPYGQTIWSAADENLCFMGPTPPLVGGATESGHGDYNLSDGVGGENFEDPAQCSAAWWIRGFAAADPSPQDPSPSHDGYQIYDLGEKEDWHKMPVDDTLANTVAAGDPVWSRVTMIRFGFGGKALGQPLSAIRYLNLSFGPTPGFLRTLRPFAVAPRRCFAVGGKPAIGFQNPTNYDANVTVYWGMSPA